MALTNYTDGKLLDSFFGGTAYTPPATVYVGLSTTTINQDGSGITEPTGGAYARVSVTNNTTNFPASTAQGTNGANGMQKQNGTAINFPQATGSWGTVTYWFIADASTAGNILAFGALTTQKTISNGDTASFSANQLTIQQQ